MNLRFRVLVVLGLIWSAGPACGGVISGTAVDLGGVPITNQNLRVTVTSPQGIPLNSTPPVIDNTTGTFSITVDETRLRQSGSVQVILRVNADGRLQAAIANFSGLRAATTIDPVLPVATPCCTAVVPCSCYSSRCGWRWRRGW